MKSIRSITLATLVLAGAAVTAQAAPITEPGQIDAPQFFFDFNAVTSVPTGGILPLGPVTIAGVTSIINTTGFPASSTFPTYTSGSALGRPDGDPAQPNYTIAFASDVAQVGFGIFDPNFENPDNMIHAYSSGGVLLETTTPDALFPPGGSGADYVGFSRAIADIGFIQIVSAPGDALWIDNLSFSHLPASVPTPATVFLMGLGLAGLALRRRA